MEDCADDLDYLAMMFQRARCFDLHCAPYSEALRMLQKLASVNGKPAFELQR